MFKLDWYETHVFKHYVEAGKTREECADLVNKFKQKRLLETNGMSNT